VHDVAWLVAVGTVCLRLPDLVHALAGVADGNLLAAVRQALGIFAQELQGPVVLSIIAGLVITLAAGRGRRSPAVDIELGAACYLPAYLGHVVVTLRGLAGLPAVIKDVVHLPAVGWMAGLVLLAVRIARRRPRTVAPPASPALDAGELGSPEAVAGGFGNPPRVPEMLVRLRDRVAITAVAAALGAGLLINTAAVARKSPAAPEFALPRVDQPGTLALASLRGQVVLLDFWATWCPPCLEMLPTMEALYGEFHPKGVEFVAINSDGPGATTDDVRAFLKRRPISYPVVIDEGEVGGRYNVTGLPHFVVLGRDGVVSRVFFGLTRREELARALHRAIGD
jgi:thiol-disulfide isomerase/thioredoxin